MYYKYNDVIYKVVKKFLLYEKIIWLYKIFLKYVNVVVGV